MRWFLDISTRSKLLAAFGLIIVFLAIVTAMAYRAITSIQESQRVLYEREFADEKDIKQVRTNQIAVRADVAVMFLTRGRAEQEVLHERIKAASKSTWELVQRLRERSSADAARLAKVEAFAAVASAYRDTREKQVIPAIYAGRLGEAEKLFITVQGQRNIDMQKLADDLVRETEARAHAALVESAQTAGSLVRLFSGAAVVAVLLSVALAIFLDRILAHPLRQLSAAAARIAGGDLTVSLPPDGRADETGILLQTFGRMVENLRSLMREVGDGVNVLASSASQITATTTQVASGSAQTASAVSETTATVEEVKQTARVATDKARQVSDTAQKTAEIAQSGRRSVDAAFEAMRHIQQQMESIAERIVRLSEQGQAIGEIIATVNDLAEQSNLLAVNAAIEAAKAGEHGKGFAVVAQEVKSLAEQSKQATAQVRTILGDIQKATSGAVMATEQGSKAVESGVQLSEELGESIRALAEGIETAAQAATQIAASAQQQLVGMDQVALAMHDINQASTQNVASTRQTEAAAQNLQTLGQSLKQAVERYRV